MPISSAVCMFQPGSVNSGGTWQAAQFALFANTFAPRFAAFQS